MVRGIMGLNHKTGEYLEGLGARFVVATAEQKAKWAGSPFMDGARDHAAQQFFEAGYRGKWRVTNDDFMVQVYPDSYKVVFLFICRVNGREMISHYTWDFSRDMRAVQHLRASGMLPDIPQSLNRVN